MSIDAEGEEETKASEAQIKKKRAFTLVALPGLTTNIVPLNQLCYLLLLLQLFPFPFMVIGNFSLFGGNASLPPPLYDIHLLLLSVNVQHFSSETHLFFHQHSIVGPG